MKRYLVQTFGCQMNVHDSRRIEEVLESQGYAATEEPSLADVIVFNTCSVREKAEQKLRSAVGTYRGLKAIKPDLVMVVAGCVAQQEGEKLLKQVPHLDVLIGPDNIPELPALVEHVRDGGAPIARTVFDMTSPQFLVARPRTDAREITSFVTVMKGCDERCTYCIVPHTRGPERYRSADEIVGEIARLVEGGVREITLLGQTVNSWHSPVPSAGSPSADAATPPHGSGEGESEFPQLLRRIASELPALARLRYTSPHPRHLTEALIAAHAELPVLPRHVHLPMQSGSDRVLKRMLRRYTAEDYVARVERLKAAVPGLTLSSDIIVGFPGETDEDFEATLAVVRRVGFVSVFGFKYSARPYTPALKLGDDVPESVKDERLQRLFAVVAEQQTAHLASLVGTRQVVLVESHDHERGAHRYTGRSERNELVHFDAPEGFDPRGQLVEVDIVEAYKHSLRGAMQGVLPQPDLPRVPRAKPAVRLPLASV